MEKSLNMLYTPLIKKAMKICFEAHASQFDRDGIPYVSHPLHLAEQMFTQDEVCVALLHDVIEKCGITHNELQSIGLSKRAIQALSLLTRDKDTSDYEYVHKIKDDEIARKVKIADLRHKSELSRLSIITNEDLKHLRQCMEARVILGDMTYHLDTPVGPFSIEVNGKPYPFVARDETREGYTYHEITDYDVEMGFADYPTIGQPDKTFILEVDVLPLVKGDELVARYDFGNNISDWGSDEHTRYNVYSKNGYSIVLGVCDDERTDYSLPAEYAFELQNDRGEYLVVESPTRHRFYKYEHTVFLQLAWRHGTTKNDAVIVGWTAGF